MIGSLLGGNHDQGVIPDSRGILGPLPINVSLTEQGLTFGGETPLTPLVTAALALNPITAPLVPVLAPLNLGGLGWSARSTRKASAPSSTVSPDPATTSAWPISAAPWAGSYARSSC